MSAPVLWILIPILLGIGSYFINNQKLTALINGIACILLAGAAIFLPIDTPLTIGTLTFKFLPSFDILGRKLSLVNADRAWLALLFGATALWILVAASVPAARRLIQLGLTITGFLVAALAVEPFLYAALLIEVAVLLTVPLVSSPEKKVGTGLLRFLIFQTIAMPFILFSGWLLAGIVANPGDLILVTRSATLLGLGFALLLAVFPFYTWIPLLAEETHPLLSGFLLWIFPTVSLFFGLTFLERYTWLRESPFLGTTLTTAGIIMLFAGGLLASFQRHLGRLLGYAVILETGFSLVALGLGGPYGLNTFLLMFGPRIISLVIWTRALTNLRERSKELSLASLAGTMHTLPYSSISIVLACLALAGFPLLASFPAHQATWEGLARQSMPSLFWVFAGSLGLTLSAIRMLVASLRTSENSPWEAHESWPQKVFFLLGWTIIILLGIVPSWVSAFWSGLPSLFEHLGR